MTTVGPYSFTRAAAADPQGLIQDENRILPGEWAWIDRAQDWSDGKGDSSRRWLMIYARCPDCLTLSTVWRLNAPAGHSHDLDPQGHLTPSVECPHQPNGAPCGFHTHPTTLRDFVDLRVA